MPIPERAQIEASIAALEAQRALLGDAIVELALAPLRDALTGERHAASAEPRHDAPLAPALDTGAATEAQRLRQISALFIDVVGSTAMSQHLDAEDVAALLDGALADFTAVVQAHGGRVLRSMGDGLFCAFGVGATREDDAERAVHAGLALLGAADATNARTVDLRRRLGIGALRVRVGVHTGMALLGGGVEAGNHVSGLAVNIAARMEQTAPAGGLRISHATFGQVRGLFEVTAEPPLQVKGVDAPLQTYLVRGIAPRRLRPARRGVAGVAPLMIGRDAELARLQAGWDALRRNASLVAFAVSGDAGLGKSRLLDEFAAWAAARPGGARCIEVRASERRAGRPYGLLRDLFTAQLGILDSDPEPAAKARWLEAMAPRLGNEADAAVLGHLLGFDFSAHPAVHGIAGEARQLRDRGFHYAVRCWRALAADGGPPLLLMQDDLHWADDGSLDFIEHLLATAADLPLLWIGLARPTLAERRPGWGDAHPALQRIDLRELDPRRSGELADALLAPLAEVPADLRELLTVGAEGNPFYMEELVNMLIDRGAIVTGSARSADGDGAPAAAAAWQLHPDKVGRADVPGTLTGVLQARLDALPPAARASLQLAAVIGPVFWDEALRLLDAQADALLPLLIERQFVVTRERSSLAGQREFGFRHHTLHQVCYASVLKRIKRPAHASVAAWLAGQPGSTHLDGVAEHYERGGDVAQAATYWHRAADAARARYANAAALAQAQRALALIPSADPARRYALTVLQVKVLNRQAERERMAQCLHELERLAEAMDDDGRRSEVAELRGRWHEAGGDAAAVLRMARIALAAAPANEPARAARAHLLAAAALQRLGRYGEAQQHEADGIRFARLAGDRNVEGQLLNQMGMACNDQGDPSAAMVCLLHAVELHRAMLNPGNEAGTIANLAYAHFVLGDYDVANTQFHQALNLCKEIGERQSEGIIRINLALVRLNQGNADEAREHASRALEVLGADGDRWAVAAAWRVLGLSDLAQGRHLTAATKFIRSRDLFDALGLGHLAMEAIAGLALSMLADANLPEALAHVEEILDRQASGAVLAGTDEPMRIHLSCFRVLSAADDPRAPVVLELAGAELSARARKISDAARREDFLRAVPSHRELLDCLIR